ncbi:MAG: tetratricopeptide repeat protein [Pseudomonadota bacterium]
MPFAGLGLHVVLALLCAMHAVRSRQQLFWLIILFSFPLLGSLVYFFVVYLPDSRLEQGARRAASAAVKKLNPTRELRAAQAALEDAPTASNQMRCAAALLDAGQAPEAARLYEDCLKGPFAADLDIRLGAARAFTECGRHAEALSHLESIRATDAAFQAEAVGLLFARCQANTGHLAEARQAFESAVQRFDSFESRVEYAVWALTQGDTATVQRLDAEMHKIMRRWGRATRQMNQASLRRLQAARQQFARNDKAAA